MNQGGVWIAEIRDSGLFWFTVHKNTGQSAKDVWLMVHAEEPEANITVFPFESKEKYLDALKIKKK